MITNPPFSYAFSLIYGCFIANYVMIFQNTIIEFSSIKKNKVLGRRIIKTKQWKLQRYRQCTEPRSLFANFISNLYASSG